MTLRDWRQYGDVEFQLQRHLTVLTGPNGSGKTVALNFIAAHYGMIPSLVATLSPDSGLYVAGVHLRAGHEMQPLFLTGQAIDLEGGGRRIPMAAPVATFEYSCGTVGQLAVPFTVDGTFMPVPHKAQELAGLHFSAFEPARGYHRLLDSDFIYQTESDEPMPLLMLRSIRKALGDDGQGDCSREVKLTIASWLRIAQDAPDLNNYLERFQSILQATLPKELEFERLVLKGSDVQIMTKSTVYLLDAASGGVGKIISMVWQIFLLSLLREEAVITIDEPENHLHPSMQQSLMAGLVGAFDGFQFIVATHSPFIVTGVREAFVYALRMEGIDLKALRLDESAQLGLTPDEVLKDVLGLPFTVPLWTARELKRIVDSFATTKLTESGIQKFVQAIQEAGLQHVLSFALHELLSKAETLDKD